MLFKVRKVNYKPDNTVTNIAYLIEDNWNDWWEYKTMYDLHYVDNNGTIHYIGSVKIGEFSMESDQERPNLLPNFTDIGDNYFSLGQSSYYYENLNKLGASIREKLLRSLNDISLNHELLTESLEEHVTRRSLLRDISLTTIKNQFYRIANGGARLTDYDFSFSSSTKNITTPFELTFEVIPESNPPTNIHVIIGRNGVGKTHLIKNMIATLINRENKIEYGVFSPNNLFANIICVAFSAFDEFFSIADNIENTAIPYIYIGLPRSLDDKIQNHNRLELLTKEFVESAFICIHGAKYNLWKKAICILESDPIFKEANVSKLKNFTSEKFFKRRASSLFGKKLSSGHKIILLTITKLVENVEEKSLVFFDEPEGHLHPPLLSAFVRALSELLIDRNGVAIIATHSPVILQEVPKSCVWKLRRSGKEAIVERLDLESFGENVGTLTNEIFGLEVTNSGFHSLLQNKVKKQINYNNIVQSFNGELGMEARSILKSLIATYDEEDS